MLCSGDFVPCDVVVGCIGFERSNFLCESLTGRCEVKTTNYLDQHMMYLADAEIDEGESDEMRQRAQIETGMKFLRSLVSPCFNYCNGTTFLLVWRGLSSLFYFFLSLSLPPSLSLSLSLSLPPSLFLSLPPSLPLALVMQVPSTHFLAPPFWNMGNSSPTSSLRACCGLTSWVSDSGVATLWRCQFPKGLVLCFP